MRQPYMSLLTQQSGLKIYFLSFPFFLMALLLLGDPASAAENRISSPNGAIQFNLSSDKNRLQYFVTFNGKRVIETSPLLISLDGVELTQNVQLSPAKMDHISETYPWRGAHAMAVNNCNVATIPARHGP